MSAGIGLLGCGVVGSAVAARAAARRDVEVVAMAVRRVTAERPCPLPRRVLDDPAAVVADPAVDIVVELMGGTDDALTCIEDALALGKPVVTANKAVMAAHGPRLRRTAAAAGVPLLFDAAVGGAAPMIRAVQALADGDRITRLEGVLNGTVTFVLNRIEHGSSLEEAVAEAQAHGLAEADPTRDLSGVDAAEKLALLAQLAFDAEIGPAEVDTLGIDWVDPDDIARAAREGKRWRLVAVATRGGCCRVEPMLIAEADPIACLTGAENLLSITADSAGTVSVSGRGAGGAPTAAAVLADLAVACRSLAR